MKRKLKVIPYNPKLIKRANYLRKNVTPGEKKLWSYLRNRQMYGYHFYRQKPANNYIIDFFCNDLLLAIEIDGQSHDGNYDYDTQRQNILENLGIHFLRFSEKEMMQDLDNVLRCIEAWILDHEPTPNPSQEGNALTF